MSLEQELLAIEEGFWTDPDRVHYYGEHMAGDAVMVFPEPTGILDEAAIIETLEGGSAWAEVRIEDVDFVHLRDSGAILAYRAHARRDGGDSYSAYAASVYVLQDDGAWRLAFHQQTPIVG
jgi:hypothetical protein